MRNIGIAFVRLGQFPDAIQSFEAVMDSAPDVQTGFFFLVVVGEGGEGNGVKSWSLLKNDRKKPQKKKKDSI